MKPLTLGWATVSKEQKQAVRKGGRYLWTVSFYAGHLKMKSEIPNVQLAKIECSIAVHTSGLHRGESPQSGVNLHRTHSLTFCSWSVVGVWIVCVESRGQAAHISTDSVETLPAAPLPSLDAFVPRWHRTHRRGPVFSLVAHSNALLRTSELKVAFHGKLKKKHTHFAPCRLSRAHTPSSEKYTRALSSCFITTSFLRTHKSALISQQTLLLCISNK